MNARYLCFLRCLCQLHVVALSVIVTITGIAKSRYTSCVSSQREVAEQKQRQETQPPPPPPPPPQPAPIPPELVSYMAALAAMQRGVPPMMPMGMTPPPPQPLPMGYLPSAYQGVPLQDASLQ